MIFMAEKFSAGLSVQGAKRRDGYNEPQESMVRTEGSGRVHCRPQEPVRYITFAWSLFVRRQKLNARYTMFRYPAVQSGQR